MPYGNRPPTQFWAKAKAAVAAHACPRCGRPAGQACRNLRTASYKAPEDLVSPHKERLDLGSKP